MSKVLQFVFTLFNLQGTDTFASKYFVRSELLYVITSFGICQALFQVFSNSFLMFVALQASAFHHATLICYHRTFCLSRCFFLIFRSSLIHLCRSQATCVYQHSRFLLSSTFLQFSASFFGVFDQCTLFVLCRTLILLLSSMHSVC